MDDATARELIALNNRFYAEHAASFGATRQAPWPGWEQLVDLLRRQGFGTSGHMGASAGAPVRVFDLACGNLRFERFLCAALPAATFELHAVDSCGALADTSLAGLPTVHFQQRDVLEAVLGNMVESFPREAGDVDMRGDSAWTQAAEGGQGADGMREPAADGAPSSSSDSLLSAPPCDLTVCFGFMHHVPGTALRRAVLEALVGATAPGGVICLSFWQFMDDARLARKATAADRVAATAPPFPGFDPAALDEHDHFLGWQDDPRPLRYCHHFPEDEVDELAAAAAGVREIARYSADGASGALNRYLVLQRR